MGNVLRGTRDRDGKGGDCLQEGTFPQYTDPCIPSHAHSLREVSLLRA